MTTNAYSAAASNNPVFAGQINQFLVDHNVGLYAYDGALLFGVGNANTPTSFISTNTGGTTGQPQMIAQSFTVGGSPITVSRLELALQAAISTGGVSGADLVVSIQTNNSGAPSGTAVCSAYIPAAWLTTTPNVLSIAMAATLSASTEYWIVVGSSASTTNYVEVLTNSSITAVVSTNGGASWSAASTGFYFVLYGGPDGLLRGVQADAGGRQISILNGMCALQSSMNGLALPQSTIQVVGGTQGFPSSGTFFLLIDNAVGSQQTVTYTGKTATTFTGCTGGSGTLATGGLCYVSGGMQPSNIFDFTAYQASVLGNILIPPDDNFATGVGTWTAVSATCTLATSTTKALFGLQSLLVTSATGSAMSMDTGGYYGITAGLSYAFQGWVLAGSSSLRNVNMAVAWFNASGTQVGSTITGSAVATSQTVWANPQLVATAPAGAVNAQVLVQWGSGTNGDTYYVNGCGLKQASAIQPWSPGGLGVGQARTLTYSSGRLVSMA